MPKTNVTYNSWGDPVASTNSSGETVWGDSEAFPSTSARAPAPAPAPATRQTNDSGSSGTYKQESFPTQAPSEGYDQETGQNQSIQFGQLGFPIFTPQEKNLMLATNLTVSGVGIISSIGGYWATSRYLRSFPTIGGFQKVFLTSAGGVAAFLLGLKLSKPPLRAFVRARVDDPAQFQEKMRLTMKHLQAQSQEKDRIRKQKLEV